MENPHDGHRQRIRERALSGDSFALKPHEVLEYLLFFAIPRRNMNPLAHQLLEQFGTLQGVFCAAPEELMQACGISRTCADWLHLAGQAILQYAEPQADPVFLTTRLHARQYMRTFFSQPGISGSWLFCLTTTGALIHALPLHADEPWDSEANLRLSITGALSCRAHSVLIARKCTQKALSAAETRHMQQLSQSLLRIQIHLLEHILLPGDGSTVCAAEPVLPGGLLAEESPLLAHWLDETEPPVN